VVPLLAVTPTNPHAQATVAGGHLHAIAACGAAQPWAGAGQAIALPPEAGRGVWDARGMPDLRQDLAVTVVLGPAKPP